MATKTINTRIQQKIDTAANWDLAVNFKPLKGELIIFTYDELPPKFKVGDGVSYVSGEPRNGCQVLPFVDESYITQDRMIAGLSLSENIEASDLRAALNFATLKIGNLEYNGSQDVTVPVYDGTTH